MLEGHELTNGRGQRSRTLLEREIVDDVDDQEDPRGAAGIAAGETSRCHCRRVPARLVPERRLRYTLTRLHARGGIGQVWLAHDADLRSAETRLAPLPAITTGDPQATMAADLVAWISLGHVSLTPHDIHRMRITGLTIIPALAGIIFMFATTLLRIGRRREPIAG